MNAKEVMMSWITMVFCFIFILCVLGVLFGRIVLKYNGFGLIRKANKVARKYNFYLDGIECVA
jgi:hypothetical protein